MLQSHPTQINSKKVLPPPDQGGQHALYLNLPHQQPDGTGTDVEGVDLTHILRFRAGRQLPSATTLTATAATTAPMSRDPAFSVVDARGNEIGSWTWEDLYDNAEKINQMLKAKTKLRKGDRVALIYRKAELLNFLAAFFGCLMAGLTAVPINGIEEIAEMTFILANSGATLALTTEYNHRALTKSFAMSQHQLKHKEVSTKTDELRERGGIGASSQREQSTMDWPTGVVWWKTDNLVRWKPKQDAISKPNGDGTKNTSASCRRVDLSDLAYIEYTKAPNGEMKGVSMSHAVILEQCRFIGRSLATSGREPLHRNTEGQNPSKRAVVMSWLEPRQQVGLIVGAWMGVYHNNHTVFLHSGATARPGLWTRCIARYSVTLAIGEYEGIKDLVKGASILPASPSGSYSSSGNSSRKSSTSSAISSQSSHSGNNKSDNGPTTVSSRFHDSRGEHQPCGHHNRTENRSAFTLQRFLVDATVIEPLLHRSFEQEVLSDLVQSPCKSTLDSTIVPMVTLPEHGGMVLSIRGSSLSSSSAPVPTSEKDESKSSLSCYFLLDREALKSNVIRVVAVAKEALGRAQEKGVIFMESFGPVPSQASVLIANLDSSAVCEVDEVGEIWINAASHVSEFWGLPELSKSTYQARPSTTRLVNSEQRGAATTKEYLRTGLFGGFIEGQLIVFGSLSERIQQEVQNPVNRTITSLIEYDYFYQRDIANTVLNRIVGFTACVALELVINGEHLPVICAETPWRVTQSKDEPSRNMDRLSKYVIQAMHDYHGLRPYCVALAAPGSLPRTRKHGRRVLHAVLCRLLLEQGRLPLIHLHTAADKTLLHLTVGDDPLGGIWGADALAARLAALPEHSRRVQWSRCESPKEVIDHRRHVDLARFTNLAEVLVWRSLVTPEDVAYLVSDYAASSLVPTLAALTTSSTPAVERKTLTRILSKRSRLLMRKNSKRRSDTGVTQGKDNCSSSNSSNTNQTSTLQQPLQDLDSFVPISFRQLGILVVRIATFLEKKCNFQAGDKVVLLFPNGIEFVATVYACWFLGFVPVPVQLPGVVGKDDRVQREDIVQLIGLLIELRLSHQPILGSSATENFFKQQSTIAHIKAYVGARQDAAVPIVFSVSKALRMGPHKTLGKESGFLSPPKVAPSSATSPVAVPSQDAAVFAQYSTDRRRTLVKATHGALMAQSKAQKVQIRLENVDPLVACWKAFSGLGFLQSCALSIYTGAPTTLIDYEEFLKAPRTYFEALEHHGVRDAVLDYTMLEKTLSSSSGPFSFNAASVYNFTLISDKSERIRVKVHQELERRFCSTASGPNWSSINTVEQAGHQRHSVNGMFSHTVNPMVSTRAYMGISPVRLYLSLEALRQGKVVVLEDEVEDSPEVTGIWVEDSGIPVCGTTVAIVNPESRELCFSHEIGEIWVSSEANVQPYIGKSPFASAINVEYGLSPIATSQFQVKLATDTPNIARSDGREETLFARTGEVGFLWNYTHPDFNEGQATSLLFVLGSIGETFEVNGLLYFPKDVEETVEKSHPSIAHNGCIVFQAEQAVVCVVQTHELAFGDDGTSRETVNLNMVLSVIHRLAESHQFVPDVIAVVAEGVLAKDRDGAKQRGKMLSLFMSAKMPLLYIHYPKGSMALMESEAQTYQRRMTACPFASLSSIASSSSLTTSTSLPTSNEETSSLVAAKDSTLAHRRPLPLSISIRSSSQTSLSKKNEDEISGLLTPASPLTNDCSSIYETTMAAPATMTAAPLTPVSPNSPVSLFSPIAHARNL